MTFSKENMQQLAIIIGAETEALMAVAEVESAGGGFLDNQKKSPYIAKSGKLNGSFIINEDVTGRPKILFEPHVFWRELKKRFYNPAGLLKRQDVRDKHGDISDILYEKWGEKSYGTEANQWGRLLRARQINADAANCSASWGFGQVLCANWESLGYESPQHFVDEQSSYDGQAKAFAKFILENNLVNFLNKHQWDSFALHYNGKGYKKNQYDVKMAAAYKKIKAGA